MMIGVITDSHADAPPSFADAAVVLANLITSSSFLNVVVVFCRPRFFFFFFLFARLNAHSQTVRFAAGLSLILSTRTRA